MAEINANAAYDKLREDIKNGTIGTCYIFHGPEQYLLQNSLSKLRALLCPDGLDGFNYKSFKDGGIDAQILAEAAEALPFFAGRTLIEIHDFDMYKCEEQERERLTQIISDLPPYVCIVFIYSKAEFKPDKKYKLTKALYKYAEIVEFPLQDEKRLVKWITGHFRDAGAEISREDAAYLVAITDGLMTELEGDIEKIAAYCASRQPAAQAEDSAFCTVRRSDIDAVVIPAVSEQAYRLTDAVVNRKIGEAMKILDNLLQKNEPPHKILFGISLKMRQLLAARICIEAKTGLEEYKKICGIYKDYPAQIMLNTARKTTLGYCRNAVLMCARAARELNSSGEPEACIIELIGALAPGKETAL